jgi:hypothetical protein
MRSRQSVAASLTLGLTILIATPMAQACHWRSWRSRAACSPCYQVPLACYQVPVAYWYASPPVVTCYGYLYPVYTYSGAAPQQPSTAPSHVAPGRPDALPPGVTTPGMPMKTTPPAEKNLNLYPEQRAPRRMMTAQYHAPRDADSASITAYNGAGRSDMADAINEIRALLKSRQSPQKDTVETRLASAEVQARPAVASNAP